MIRSLRCSFIPIFDLNEVNHQLYEAHLFCLQRCLMMYKTDKMQKMVDIMYNTDKHKVNNFDEMANEGSEWIQQTLGLVNLQHVGSGVPAFCFTTRREVTRDAMAKSLSAALNIVNKQAKYIVQLEKNNRKHQSDAIVSQGIVVGLRKELLAAKDQHVNDLKDIAVTSVEDTVKTQSKTHNNANVVYEPKSSEARPLLELDQNVLKDVVKNNVAVEDRSRKLMILV